jgi:hypothetical protein
MAKGIQASFTGGELASSLHARVDLTKYETGLATCFNTFIQAHGGASNRPGTQFICEVKDSSKVVRLMPFSFSTEQTYILIASDYNMRFIKDEGQILEATKTITGATQANPCVITASSHGFSNGEEVYIAGIVGMTELNGRNFKVAGVTTHTFQLQTMAGVNLNSSALTAYSSAGTASRVYTITTAYPEGVLFDLRKAQSADVMTFCHPSYAVRDLTRTGHTAWTFSEVSFSPTQTHPTALAATADTTGSVTDRYTVTAYNEEDGEESLAGVGPTKAISGITQANPAVVTTATHGFVDYDMIHIESVVGMTELNGRRFVINQLSSTTFELTGVDSSGYTAYSSGGTAALAFVELTNSASTRDNTITWTAASGADKYNVYRSVNGIFGFIGSAESVTFTDNNKTPDETDTPPRERNPFRGSGNWPSTVSYFEQRKVYANTTSKPQTIWFSQSANFDNMTFSSPRKDDDSITRTIAAREVNECRHLVPLTDLIVLTSGGEWRVSAGQNEVITPTSVIVKPQEFRGASKVEPIVVGNTVLYVQEQGSTVRDLGYKLESDGYTGTDVSILANHLFYSHTIVDWAYQETPNSIVWCVRDDGVLLGLTYLREHEVWAWHRHEIAGTFEGKDHAIVESVAVVSEGTEDAVYLCVKRTVNSLTKRYIERLHTRVFEDVEDAFFVDSGLTLDNPVTISAATQANPVVVTANAHGFSNGDIVDIENVDGMTDINNNGWKVSNKATNTFELQDSNGDNVNGTAFSAYVANGKVRKAVTSITGLNHLEGQEVVVLANGYVVTGLTVSAGGITLPNAASRVHIGLGYESAIETLNPEVKSTTRATVQSDRKRISNITVRVETTRGVWIGPDSTRTVEMKQGLNELTTGDLSMAIRPTWNTAGRVYIKQPSPLPMTVLAVVPDVTVGS